MRFRVEANLGPMQSLTASKVAEQGLEAPESFFVELADFELENGPANPDEIVEEIINGKTVSGVT